VSSGLKCGKRCKIGGGLCGRKSRERQKTKSQAQVSPSLAHEDRKEPSLIGRKGGCIRGLFLSNGSKKRVAAKPIRPHRESSRRTLRGEESWGGRRVEGGPWSLGEPRRKRSSPERNVEQTGQDGEASGRLLGLKSTKLYGGRGKPLPTKHRYPARNAFTTDGPRGL